MPSSSWMLKTRNALLWSCWSLKGAYHVICLGNGNWAAWLLMSPGPCGTISTHYRVIWLCFVHCCAKMRTLPALIFSEILTFVSHLEARTFIRFGCHEWENLGNPKFPLAGLSYVWAWKVRTLSEPRPSVSCDISRNHTDDLACTARKCAYCKIVLKSNMTLA